MFLIQYGVGLFVNAKNIGWIDAGDKGNVLFGLTGDVGCAIKVEAEFCDRFFNHLQSLNDNIENVESYWHKLNTI